MSVQVHRPPSHLWTAIRGMHLKGRRRPDTATLPRPQVLDPELLRKVDMTRLTRDRLATIENLLSTPKKSKSSPNTQKTPVRSRSKDSGMTMTSWEDDDSSAAENPKMKKTSGIMNTTFRVRSHVRKGLREVFTSPTQLQPPPSIRKDTYKVKSPKVKEPNIEKKDKTIDDVFGALVVKEPSVPSPCNSCGRAERPERLHAHPVAPRNKRSKLRDDQENATVEVVPQPRSSVTKPVAMKFRSGKTRGETHPEVDRPSPDKDKEAKDHRRVTPLIRRETFKIERSPIQLSPDKKLSPTSSSPSPFRKGSLQINPPPRRSALPRTPDKQSPRLPTPSPASSPSSSPGNPPVVHSGNSRRPRTITCYLCLKQFGTASYPLHEQQCIQRWHRENQALPASQQLPEPQRPDASAAAWDPTWQAAQAAMVTCEGCAKTFLPHRLDAHLRVCPRGRNSTSPLKQVQQQQSHHVQQELQLRRREDLVEREREGEGWESDRSELSTLLAEGPPSVHCHICGRVFNREAIERHEQQCLKRWKLEHSQDSTSSAPTSTASSPPTTPRRRLVLCYLCGRQFGSASIAIHEPQCLRKWHQENEKLPQHQRRPEPPRPAPVYDSETGQIDYQATQDAQWQCHLVHLVPCGKCGRTFSPDRVSVHEKCCKGPAAPIKH